MKKILLLIILLSISCYVLAQMPTPVAKYTFTGNANDESGNGNNGTLAGNIPTLTTDRFGNPNAAYQFGGYYSPSWILVNNSTSLQFNKHFSISLWYKQCNPGGMDGWGNYSQYGSNVLYGKAGDGYAAAPGIYSSTNLNASGQVTNHFNNKLCYGSSASCHQFGLSAEVPCYDSCEWIHVVHIVDSNVSRMYLNGKLADTSVYNAPANFTVANTQPLYIGKMDGSWYPFGGVIDDIHIFNVALTDNQVKQLFGNFMDTLSLNLFVDKDSFCIGDEVIFTATGGSVLTWIVNTTYSNIGNNSISIYPDTTMVVKAVIMSSQSCIDTVEKTVYLKDDCPNNCQTIGKWRGFVNQLNLPTIYYPPQDFINPDSNWFHIPPPASYYWSGFELQDTLCITSNFAAELRVKTGPPLGIAAYDTHFGILTTNGACGINLMGAAWGMPWTSIYVMNTTVLSNHPSLIFPSLYDWSVIKLKFNNNILYYYVNDTLVFNSPYTGDICNIYGFNFLSKGSGYCDWVKIYDNNDSMVFFEDFNHCDSLSTFVSNCDNPEIDIDIINATCNNDTFYLTANVLSSNLLLSFEWFGPQGLVGNAQDLKLFNLSSAQYGYYYCYATLNSCFAVAIDSVYVDSLALNCNTCNNASVVLMGDDTLDYCNDCQLISPNLDIIAIDTCFNFNTVKIYFTSGYMLGEDTLQFVSIGGVTASFNAVTGVLTLSGNVSNATWQTILRSVCYKSLVGNNSNTVKNIVIVLGDALYNPGNGHYYRLINNGSNISWTAARDSSAASAYFGMQGYLVTITSQAENDFLTSLINSNTWLGGSDAAQEGVWRWVTGCEGLEDGGQGRLFFNDSPFLCNGGGGIPISGIYTNWHPAQPDNCGCDAEDYLHMLPQGNWNDYPNDLSVTSCASSLNHYIIEYGCMPGDSTNVAIRANIVVNIHGITDTSISHSVCSGDSFLGYTASGVYIDTFVNSNSCDSIRTLTLTVHPHTASSINQAICSGDSFLGYTVSGVYIDTLINSNGCDSVRTLTLTVHPHTSNNISHTICSGDSFLGYTASGVYVDTFINSNGCDSIRTLTLTVNPHTASAISQSICSGDSFLGYTASGVYTDTLVNSNGCDSIRTLTLTVHPHTSSAISHTMCSGDSFLGYTTSGVYTDTLVNSNGCDSIRTLTLTINPHTTSSISQAICSGDSFLGYTASGVYIDTLVNSNGCDSVRTLTLTVNSNNYITIDTTLCFGGHMSFHNQLITTAGTYSHTFTNANNCDSNVTMKVSIAAIPPKEVFIHKDCNKVSFRGEDYFTTNLIIDTFKNTLGCDSIYHYHSIQILHSNQDTVKADICEGESYHFGGNEFFNSTVYSASFTNQWGCDSVTVLDLTVHPNPVLTASILPTGQKDFYCVGDTLTIVPSGASEYWFYNKQKELLSQSDDYQTMAHLVQNHYVIIGRSSFGCYDTLALSVNAEHCCDIFIPNAFSPNGDGLNDKIGPIGYTTLQNHTFYIYNRFGQQVFKSNKMNDNWDGTYSGKPCDVGSYFYIFMGKCGDGKEVIRKGDIMLMR